MPPTFNRKLRSSLNVHVPAVIVCVDAVVFAKVRFEPFAVLPAYSCITVFVTRVVLETLAFPRAVTLEIVAPSGMSDVSNVKYTEAVELAFRLNLAYVVDVASVYARSIGLPESIVMLVSPVYPLGTNVTLAIYSPRYV